MKGIAIMDIETIEKSMAAIEIHNFNLPENFRVAWEAGEGFWMIKIGEDAGLERFRGVTTMGSYRSATIDVDVKKKYAYVNGKTEKVEIARLFLKLYGGKCFFDGEPLDISV